MSDLTLNGEIPGLLRRGSPGEGGVVVIGFDAMGAVMWSDGSFGAAAHDLDLTDPTGRVHAVWWAERTSWSPILARDTERLRDLIAIVHDYSSCGDEWWTDDRVAFCRDICLKLAA